MTLAMVFLFIVIILLFIYYFYNKWITTKYKCFIDVGRYPELKIFEKNIDIFKKDIDNIKNKRVWTKYQTLHEKKILNNDNEKIQNMLNNEQIGINESNEPTWLVFGVVANGEPLKNAMELCPLTVKLLSKNPKIKTAGFSCLEANATIPKHTDDGSDVYRYHMPILIPDGDCGINVNGIKKDFSKSFIFDDTYEHYAWNNTEDMRIVLIIDLERQ